MKTFSKFINEVKKPTGNLKDACWTGYTSVGMKMKGGRKVPNCVPEEVEIDEETQAEETLRRAGELGDELSLLTDKMHNFLRNKKIPGFMKHGMKESLITSLITQKDPVKISKALNSPLIRGKHRTALNNALNQLRVKA